MTRPGNRIAAEDSTAAAVAYDSRFKRLSQDPRFVIINNFKCGYSSSNLLATEPVRKITADDRVILFYRNIHHRAVSVFINWCITDDRYRGMEGWLFDNIREALTVGDFDRFVDDLHADRFDKAFATYVSVLGAIYHKNNHTLPQTEILDYFGVRRIDFFVNLDDSEKFKTITGVTFPFDAGNASDRTIKTRCLDLLETDRTLRATVSGVYEDDVVFFRKNGISIDEC